MVREVMIDPATKVAWACPLNGKLCIDGSREDFPKNSVGAPVKCRWWQHLSGKDPQSEKMVDQYDCAVAWLPTVGIEGAQMSRQTAASVDKVATGVGSVEMNLAALARSITVAAASIRQSLESGQATIAIPAPGKELPSGENP